MLSSRRRLWSMQALFICMIAIAPGTAQDKSGPVTKPAQPDASTNRTRVIEEGMAAKSKSSRCPTTNSNSPTRMIGDATEPTPPRSTGVVW